MKYELSITQYNYEEIKENKYKPCILENGATYYGKFKGKYRHGLGKIIWSDGAEYSGG